MELYDSVFDITTSPAANAGRDRSVSLWEHRQISHFHWEITPTDLSIREVIGHGSFGSVYKARWMGTNVAVKTIDSSSLTTSDYRQFLSEVSMMSNLRHPNVLSLLGGCIKPPNLCLVTEYMQQGSLDKVLSRYPHLDWRIRLGMALESARGLLYLHLQNPPILHRDLKSLNILVDENFHVKVADFGLSADKNGHLSHRMGTLNWVAPEILDVRGPGYDEKSDIYSFGMVLWEIASGRIPFAGMTELQILRRIDMRETEEIPDSCPVQYANVIRSCWHQDPAKRPSIAEILESLESLYEELGFT